MGVSGCGKTAVGQQVAERWGAGFQDADDWHTEAAVAKMASGQALTDEDRTPWLERLRDQVIGAVPEGARGVLACSALRKQYRDALRQGQNGLKFIYLSGSQALIAGRMAARRGHYMPSSLLDSQFAALEPPEPEEALTVSVDQPLAAVMEAVLQALR
jgi:carbohydrate kinase (thermoresistant glucokinase family)